MHRCEICLGVFTQRSNLLRHIRTVHGNPQYQCALCETTFTRVQYYNEHIKNRESCPHCNLTCCGKRALYSHVKVVHGEKPHPVPVIREWERIPIQPLISAMGTSHILSAAVRKKCNHIYTDSDGHYHTQDILWEDIPDNIFINTVTTTGNPLF